MITNQSHSVNIIPQYIYTVGSLQAKTIVTRVRIFWEPSKPLESNWLHNSDIVNGFELCQMIAIVLKFYEFCLHLTKLSPSPFFMALNVEEHHFSQLSYTHRRSQDFWLGGPKPQITRNDVIRNFRKSNFLWGKDIIEWKIWSRSLMALCQDFGKGRGQKLIIEKCKSLTWKTCWVS